MNIGIIVLNYMCWEATLKCVACFRERITELKLSDPENDIHVQIVIVDNDSSNDSYAKLLSEYKDNGIVHVLKTERNIGTSASSTGRTISPVRWKGPCVRRRSPIPSTAVHPSMDAWRSRTLSAICG